MPGKNTSPSMGSKFKKNEKKISRKKKKKKKSDDDTRTNLSQ
jgi:hypothetical protein